MNIAAETDAIAEGILNLRPAWRPNDALFEAIPSIDHCIGRGRLLGEKYAYSLAEAIPSICQQELPSLQNLCLLMRTFIVLDDYVKDSRPPPHICEWLREWLRGIAAAAIVQINDLGENGTTLWSKFKCIYESAYNSYSVIRPFLAIQQKCAFLFLPFDLQMVYTDRKACQRFRAQISRYLFALQLLDDFHDMDEDLKSLRNHNLFTCKLEKSRAQLVLRNRTLLARSLLRYIAQNLESSATAVCDSSTFRGHLEGAFKWCHTLLKAVPPEMFRCFRGDFRRFHFHSEAIPRITPDRAYGFQFVCDLIRAENMHSATIDI